MCSSDLGLSQTAQMAAAAIVSAAAVFACYWIRQRRGRDLSLGTNPNSCSCKISFKRRDSFGIKLRFSSRSGLRSRVRRSDCFNRHSAIKP